MTKNSEQDLDLLQGVLLWKIVLIFTLTANYKQTWNFI